MSERQEGAIQQTLISAKDAYLATALAWVTYAVVVWNYPGITTIVLVGGMAVAVTLAAFLASGAYERFPQ